MARKARNTLTSNLVLVTQHSSHCIFRDKDDRDQFMRLLEKTQTQYQCNILAFCCAQEDGFQLVLDTQGASISRILQSISIAYAMYRKSDSPLFEQRYKSIALETLESLKDTIQKVGLSNPDYAGCCFVNEKKHPWLKPLKLSDAKPVLTKKLMDPENCVKDWLIQHNVSKEDLLQNKKLRNQAILDLRQNSNCTLKKLAKAFDMSESSISKILRQS